MNDVLPVPFVQIRHAVITWHFGWCYPGRRKGRHNSGPLSIESAV